MSQQFYMYFENISCSESEYVTINGKETLHKSYTHIANYIHVEYKDVITYPLVCYVSKQVTSV